jgi:protein TonB
MVQKGESPMKVSAADERPKLIKEIKPVYPEIARQSMVQGVVVIQAFIDEEGQVYVAKVIKSVPLLDQAAIDAVRQWKYSPAKLNGKPVRVQADITITFRLK